MNESQLPLHTKQQRTSKQLKAHVRLPCIPGVISKGLNVDIAAILTQLHRIERSSAILTVPRSDALFPAEEEERPAK